jgi:hypothetical protein
MAAPPRRFPAPWRADTMPGGYVARDANRQRLRTSTPATTRPKPGRQKCSQRTRRDGSPSTSRGCRSCSGRVSTEPIGLER